MKRIRECGDCERENKAQMHGLCIICDYLRNAITKEEKIHAKNIIRKLKSGDLE